MKTEKQSIWDQLGINSDNDDLPPILDDKQKNDIKTGPLPELPNDPGDERILPPLKETGELTFNSYVYAVPGLTDYNPEQPLGSSNGIRESRDGNAIAKRGDIEIAVVTDGVGGDREKQDSRLVAIFSQFIADTAVAFLVDQSQSDLEKLTLNQLADFLADTAKKFWQQSDIQEALKDPDFETPATTLVIAITVGNTVQFLNIGDSLGGKLDVSGLDITTVKHGTGSRITKAVKAKKNPSFSEVVPSLSSVEVDGKGDEYAILYTDGMEELVKALGEWAIVENKTQFFDGDLGENFSFMKEDRKSNGNMYIFNLNLLKENRSINLEEIGWRVVHSLITEAVEAGKDPAEYIFTNPFFEHNGTKMSYVDGYREVLAARESAEDGTCYIDDITLAVVVPNTKQ